MQHSFAAGHAQSGFCPELRTIFYRLASYSNIAVHLVFVEDGPGRPTDKRNKKVLTASHWMTNATREFAAVCGFDWHTVSSKFENYTLSSANPYVR